MFWGGLRRPPQTPRSLRGSESRCVRSPLPVARGPWHGAAPPQQPPASPVREWTPSDSEVKRSGFGSDEGASQSRGVRSPLPVAWGSGAPIGLPLRLCGGDFRCVPRPQSRSSTAPLTIRLTTLTVCFCPMRWAPPTPGSSTAGIPAGEDEGLSSARHLAPRVPGQVQGALRRYGVDTKRLTCDGPGLY